MRNTYYAAAIALLIASGQAQALGASDTIAAWRGASSDARSKIVTDLLKRDGREGSISSVLKCLDAASSISGQADLLIKQVVAACAKENGQPV